MESTLPTLPAALADRLELLAPLGEGAMGAVYRARDRRLDREVAVKFLHRSLPEEARERFDREAALLARLRSPNVVEVYDYAVTDEGCYLVMELLEGRSLEEAPPEDPLGAILEVAGALEVVHAAGVCHRDVKPANILRTGDGRTVLVDFGLARDEAKETITRTGTLVGTPGYFAPELWAGQLPGPAADWFALGATLYVLLEGEPPWSAGDLLDSGRGRPLPELRLGSIRRGSPEHRVVGALLATSPKGRPRSRRELERILSSSGSTALSATRFSDVSSEPTKRAPPRKAVALLLGALAAGAYALLPGSPEPTPPPVATVPDERTRELRERLDRAVEVLIRDHRSRDGSLRYARGDDAPADHLVDVMLELQDARAGIRWKRFLEALPSFLEAAPEAEADRYLMETVFPVVAHLTTDHLMVTMRRFTPQAFGPPVRREEAAAGLDLELAKQRLQELLELRLRCLEALEPLLDRSAVLLVAGQLLLDAPNEKRLAMWQRFRERIRRTTDPAARTRFVVAMEYMAPLANSDMKPFTCDDRGARVETLLGHLEGTEDLARNTRARLVTHALTDQYFFLNSCQKELSGDVLANLNRFVELLERDSAEVSGELLVHLEILLVFYRAGGFYLANFGEGFQTWIRRVEALAVEVDTRLRGSPRGWPPGRPPGPMDVFGASP